MKTIIIGDGLTRRILSPDAAYQSAKEHLGRNEIRRTMGEIKPAGSREAEVIAPFSGMLMPDVEGRLVRPGEQVRRGDHLAVLAPTMDEEGWFKLLSDYRLAQAEHHRVSELQKSGSVALRRVQESELNLQLAEARLRAALGDAEIESLDTTDMLFCLRAR